MNTDKKVEIADQIYRKLVNVQRTEWNKWIQFLREKGWDKALRLATLLSKSPMLRPQPQKNYEKIHTVMNQERKRLEKINLEDVLEIGGYISWKLATPIGFGMWKHEETKILHRHKHIH
jgi:hypothetical protein